MKILVLFLALFWRWFGSIALKVARCKTSVDVLSYGIGIDVLKGGSQEEMCVQCLSTDTRTDGGTDGHDQTLQSQNHSKWLETKKSTIFRRAQGANATGGGRGSIALPHLLRGARAAFCPPTLWHAKKHQYVTHDKIVSLYCNLNSKTENFLTPPAQIIHKMLEFARPLRKAKFPVVMACRYHYMLLLQRYL